MESEKNVFLLIDGSAIVHRAYHAMPPLTTSKGFDTGAIHGFFSMLLKVIHQFEPEYLAVAFDRPVPTFRQQLYVGYQAQRPKLESDLSAQFGAIIELLAKAKIPTYAVDGYEADDIIGTIAHKAKSMGNIVYIVTGDRDMMQLVNHKTRVLMPLKGISEVSIYDEEKVIEKFGVPPEKIIELKALQGDQSDNYPGVPGVGPKTAASLVGDWGSVEGIYEHLGDIQAKNPKLAERLVAGAEHAILGKTLATILNDVPFVYDVQDSDISKFDIDAWKGALEAYEMKTLPKRIDEVFKKNGKVNTDGKTQMKLI